MLFPVLLFLIASINSYACSCDCIGDCSFSSNISENNFIALVKIISFDDVIKDEIPGYEGQMPLSMTVEIIQKFQGSEKRKQIKIWGDNGALCRPYLGDFEIGEYYMIAPNMLGEYHYENESPADYDFFVCTTDYLKVDMEQGVIYGKYSRWKNKITLEKFQKGFEQ